MIRPSLLQIAERCGLAPKLAADFPEASPAADRGSAIHAEIARALLGGTPPESREGLAACGWASKLDIAGVEVPVRLLDPETADVITEGTADIVAQEPEVLTVVDWKTGRPENVAPADDNLQLLAYGLAAGLQADAPGFRVIAAFLDGDKVTTDESRFYPAGTWWPLLERVKAAATRPPVATPGAHCGLCYQRAVCPSYRERAQTALALLPKNGAELALNDHTAAELMVRVKAVRDACDLAEEMAKAHVKSGGTVQADGMTWGPRMVAGRRSGPSVKELESTGLGHLVKQGAPSERWEWRRG